MRWRRQFDCWTLKSNKCSLLIERCIPITNKSNLNWLRNFEDLRHVINKLQLQPGVWTSPWGYCKLFENGKVLIRWYANSKTLTVKGEKDNEIKKKLLNFYRKLPEVSFDPGSPRVENANFVLKSPDENLRTRPRRCSVNPEMSRTDDQSYSSNIIEANYKNPQKFMK